MNHDHLYPVRPVWPRVLYPFLSAAPYACLALDLLHLSGSPSHPAAYHTGSTSVRADRPISSPFTLQAQYFAHRFSRAHLFVFSSLSITSTSFSQTRLPSPAWEILSTAQHNTPLAGFDATCLTGAY